MLTFRRSDGREISLREFPLAQVLSRGGTVRGRGDRHRRPGGEERHRAAQRNAHPLRRGRVEPYVVTLQDMTAVEELERLRAGSWPW